MLLSEKPIAAAVGLLSIYLVGMIGMLAGLSIEMCLKRALIGALITYVVSRLAVRLVNKILTKAMIDDISRQRNRTADNKY